MDTCRPQKNQRKLKQSEERRGVGGRRESESEWRRRWSGNGVAGEGGGSEKVNARKEFVSITTNSRVSLFMGHVCVMHLYGPQAFCRRHRCTSSERLSLWGHVWASSRPRQAGLRNRTLSRPKRLFHAPPLALPKSPT
ncbi:hypothetical protein SAY87_029906 [Trapa incisa]|uniref:Uncharacterized protein n=1 Tax=Trapa incisa TaxID=236973 RepID=A0AAN7KDW4_9MYRT|nr:hypothetical protein SAY87_029906 [Trapa incisa]